jgi:CrcB protein
MWKSVALVFMGGAAGAVLRECFMLLTPRLADNFPLDILVANLLACLLLGIVTGLLRRRVVSEGTNLFLGTGVAGGLSTFSSFAYGTVVLMSGAAASTVVATLYVLSSLLLGYLAVVCGLQVAGRWLSPRVDVG